MAEKPEDLNLPNAVVGKIIKETLPEGVAIAKEARVAISKAASIFVLYATSSANNFSVKHKRKTLASQDVLSAMEEMEFDQFIEPLKECLEAHKKGQSAKRSVAEKRKASNQKETAPAPENSVEDLTSDLTVNEEETEDSEPTPSKSAKAAEQQSIEEQEVMEGESS